MSLGFFDIKKCQPLEWSGGIFRDFFPENWVIDHLKIGKTLHPIPCHQEKLFQQTLIGPIIAAILAHFPF